jgi:hypothetical protein
MPTGEPVWCEVHNRLECRHKSKRTQQRCHGAALKGLDSCYQHAGSRERVLMSKALGLHPGGHFQPVPTHPAQALLDEVAFWSGMCAWLDHIVGGLEQGELTWGVTSQRVTLGPGGKVESGQTVREAVLNTWFGAQLRAHESKARVARLALEGIAEERLIRMAEHQGTAIFEGYQAGLEMLGLSEEQWERARESYPVVLKHLNAGGGSGPG